jgi:hypothetical protein
VKVLLVEYSQLNVIPVIVVELEVCNTKLEPAQIVVVPFVPSVNSMIGSEGTGFTVIVLAVRLDIELQLDVP